MMIERHENSNVEPQTKEFDLELGDTLLNWKIQDFEDILPGQEGAGENFQWEEMGTGELVLED